MFFTFRQVVSPMWAAEPKTAAVLGLWISTQPLCVSNVRALPCKTLPILACLLRECELRASESRLPLARGITGHTTYGVNAGKTNAPKAQTIDDTPNRSAP